MKDKDKINDWFDNHFEIEIVGGNKEDTNNIKKGIKKQVKKDLNKLYKTNLWERKG